MSSSAKKGKEPPKGSLKQGNLFSFFSKKPVTNNTSKKPASTAASTAKAASTSNKSKSPLASKTTAVSQTSTPPPSPPLSTKSSSSKSSSNLSKNPDWKQVTLGTKISVYWPDDEQFYEAQVQKQRGSSSTFYLKYDDDEEEWIDISTEQFQIIVVTGATTSSADNDNDNDNDIDASSKRRRRIDDSDSEQEFEMESEPEADDDEDAYDPKSAPKEEEQEEEDDDQWMVTDDEDADGDGDDVSSKKKKRKPTSKKLKVTHHKESYSAATSSPSTTNTNMTNAYKTPLKQFANSVSPQTDCSQKKAAPTPPTNPRRQIVPSPLALPSSTVSAVPVSSSTRPPQKAPDFTRNAVNPRGAHLHNHLNFLTNPQDLQGRRPGEPGYDARTLKVNPREWETRNQGKMTDAVQQWWDLKSQYFDTFLFFKTGKFYEIYHMDADIAVDVLGLIYMKVRPTSK